MKCYLINLDRAPERLARMVQLLESHGVDFERVPAIDAVGFSEQELSLYRSQRQFAPAMAPGDIACGASHLHIMRRIANGDDPYAVIMEDDINLASDIGLYLNSSDWIPRDADMVKLETFVERTAVGGKWTRLPKGRAMARLHRKHGGAALYVISKEAAARLVENFVAGLMCIDEYMFGEQLDELKVYQVYPAPAVQESRGGKGGAAAYLDSYINQQRISPDRAKPKGLTKIRREVRRLRLMADDGWSRFVSNRRTGKVPFKS